MRREYDRRQYNAVYAKKHKAEIAIAQKTRWQKRKDAGICARCGKEKTHSGAAICEKCRDYLREYHAYKRELS